MTPSWIRPRTARPSATDRLRWHLDATIGASVDLDDFVQVPGDWRAALAGDGQATDYIRETMIAFFGDPQKPRPVGLIASAGRDPLFYRHVFKTGGKR